MYEEMRGRGYEQIEDYCMSRAIDEGQKTPLMNREDVIAFLDEEGD